jgi:hypothetical protein
MELCSNGVNTQVSEISSCKEEATVQGSNCTVLHNIPEHDRYCGRFSENSSRASQHGNYLQQSSSNMCLLTPYGSSASQITRLARLLGEDTRPCATNDGLPERRLLGIPKARAKRYGYGTKILAHMCLTGVFCKPFSPNLNRAHLKHTPLASRCGH